MVEVTLGLGGNLGDPVAAFAGALEALDQHPQVTVRARSSVYRTAPWGKTDQPDFSNMAALLILTSVMIFLIGLVAEQLALLRLQHASE